MKMKSIKITETLWETLSESKGDHTWDEFIRMVMKGENTSPDPLDGEAVEYFKESKPENRDRVMQALETVELTPKQLVKTASKLSGIDEVMIVRQGTETLAQKLITTALSPKNSGGSVGSADGRIKDAVNDLLKRMVSGELNSVTITKVSQLALTNPRTAKSALYRLGVIDLFKSPLSLHQSYGDEKNRYTPEKHAIVVSRDWINPDTVKELESKVTK